jgi:hypothetical protein
MRYSSLTPVGQRKYNMDFEAVVISKVLTENLMEEALDLNVQEDIFHEYKREWKFIQQMYLEHSGLPTTELLESKFPEFQAKLSEEPLSYLVEELKKKHVHAVVLDTMTLQADALKKKDPYAALNEMRKAIAHAEETARTSRDYNVASNPEARLSDYFSIVECEGMTGLPSPWDVLDKETGGFQEEDLVMIAARGGVGKTWAEVVIAEFLRRHGYPTVVFSKEMSVKQIVRRFDAVSAQVNFQRLKTGQLTTEELERYTETLRKMKGTTPMHVSGDIDTKMGVSSVAAKIDKYRPAMVWIDGVYMMRDERNAKAGWEKFTNICEDLKNLAQRKRTPIGVSHQFNLSGKEDKGDADTLKYGDVQMWFDVMIGMYQTEDLRANSEMLFKINKLREGRPTQWVSAWCLNKMNFQVKSSGVDDVGDYDSGPADIGYEDKVPF